MFDWIKSYFAWKAFYSDNNWVYEENSVTLQRKATWRSAPYGQSKLDVTKINSGDIVIGEDGKSTIWKN